MKSLETYEDYCKAFADGGEARGRAELLYMLRSYLLAFQAMDPQKNGYITVDQLLDKEDMLAEKGDYLSGIVRSSERAFRYITGNMRTNIVRENVMMPIYKAREFNEASIAWLSRRPGRNTREKLAGTRSVLAVRRRMSPDTAENRLLKAFARRLEDALFLKDDYLPAVYQDKGEQQFSEFLHRFRMQPEYDEIKPWRNTPPNNTLLADKNYNAIWRAWNELALTDAKIKSDDQNLGARLAGLSTFLLIRAFGRYARFPQMPLFYCGHDAKDKEQAEMSDFDARLPFRVIQAYTAAGRVLQMELYSEMAQLNLIYGGKTFWLAFVGMKSYLSQEGTEAPVEFDISAETFPELMDDIAKRILGQDASGTLERAKAQPFRGDAAGIDLFMLRPALWLHGQEAAFSGKLFYQHLTLPGGMECDVDCSHAQAMLAADEQTAVLYTLSRLVSEDDEQSMRHMMPLFSSLHRELQAEKLYFLYPDYYNEFQLTTLKRTAKMYYHHVTALPRSLAAVFTFVKSREFSFFRRDDVVLVIDRSDGGSSATLVRGEYQREVEKAIPESRGIVWEHHPAGFYEDRPADTDNLLLHCMEREELVSLCDEMFFWEVGEGSWQYGKAFVPPARKRKDLTYIVKQMRERQQKLVGNRRVWILQIADIGIPAGKPAELIDYTGKNLLGGVERYFAWRRKTAQPLWRDCLPDLAIKRLYGKLDLVTNTKFVYGDTLSMPIPVASTFVLPKGQDAYHFELQMENANAQVPYEAVIEHKAFPLPQDAECSLEMRYTYGADNPYSLSFVPLDPKQAGFRRAQVRWERIEGYPAEGNKYPQFPEAGAWEELQHFPDKRGAYRISPENSQGPRRDSSTIMIAGSMKGIMITSGNRLAGFFSVFIGHMEEAEAFPIMTARRTSMTSSWSSWRTSMTLILSFLMRNVSNRRISGCSALPALTWKMVSMRMSSIIWRIAPAGRGRRFSMSVSCSAISRNRGSSRFLRGWRSFLQRVSSRSCPRPYGVIRISCFIFPGRSCSNTSRLRYRNSPDIRNRRKTKTTGRTITVY